MQGFKKMISCLLVSLSLITLLSSFNSYASSYHFNYSCFDARNCYTKTLEPKYQQISGPCWAFASIATLEGYLSKNSLLRESLSEKHMLNWANRSYGPGWKLGISSGGNKNISTGYFASGDGVVLNNQCPFDTCNSYFSPSQDNMSPAFSVRGIQFFENLNDKDVIKEAIANYGAVFASTSSHAFSLIGWNDRSSSWIVKDSGDSTPYHSVPYHNELSSLYCITDAKVYDENEKIYQHDKFTANSFYKKNNNLTCANVFNFSSGESLDSVMVKSSSSGAKIKIYYAPVSQDGTPNSNPATWQQVYSGTVPYNGYHTYSLDKKLSLQNNKGSIIISVESDISTIGAQVQESGLELEQQKIPTSFELLDSQFFSLECNLSIKAITKKH